MFTNASESAADAVCTPLVLTPLMRMFTLWVVLAPAGEPRAALSPLTAPGFASGGAFTKPPLIVPLGIRYRGSFGSMKPPFRSVERAFAASRSYCCLSK